MIFGPFSLLITDHFHNCGKPEKSKHDRYKLKKDSFPFRQKPISLLPMIDSKLKVLIVDDDPRFLEVMKSSLESKNCLVQCATEEKKALSLLSNDIFHAVFIDCVLASGEGTKLIQDIKSAIGSSVEIIMMSGIVSEKSLSSYIDLGVCDFLSKPISDKEIEKNLNKIREKYIYGHKQNILTKLFKSNNSEIQNLKFLISLKKAKDYEFFLYLNSALSSKESLIIEFKFNNMSHKIMCDKQTIINYECDSSKIFLNRLLSKNLISAQEIGQLKGHSQEECINILLEKCILSSGQILDIKYDMLIETLKEICPGIDISLNVNLVSSHNFSFLLFNKDEYADLIFLFLKQKFNNQLFSLFDENTMNKSLIFKDRSLNYLPEIEGFIEDLKSGMKLKGIYNKYMNDKNSFCSYLFYVLLKGNVYLSEDTTNLKYYRFYERYQSLYKFINKIKKPEHLFLHLSGLPKTSEIETIKIKEAYLHFIKCNHPDSIPFDLPKDLSDLINKILGKVKLCYDLCCDPALKIQERQKMKQKNVEKEILLTEKKKNL